MRGKRLLDEVTVDELMQMREGQGMTNQQIADALDVNVNVIRRYIGNQPKGIRKPREYKAEEPKKQEAAPAPAASACLVVQNREIELKGVCGSYMIDCKNRQMYADVNLFGEEKNLVMSIDDIPGIIGKMDEFKAELQAIAAKMDALTMQNEMW